MKKLLVYITVAFSLAACSNSQSTTSTTENKDTASVRDISAGSESGTVTPPASNGQY